MKHNKLFILLILFLFACASSEPRRQVFRDGYRIPAQYSTDHEWVGDEVIFFKKKEEAQPYGYRGFSYDEEIRQAVPYEDLAGHKAEIIGYRPGNWFSKVIFRVKKTNFIVYTRTISEFIDDVAFVSEKGKAEKYIGRTIWNRGNPTEACCTANNKYIKCERKIGNFEAMTLEAVEWSHQVSAPLKFIFTTADGLSASWYGSFSGRNNTEEVIFENNWYLEDPRLVHADWDEQVWRAIENNEVFAGMNKQQVVLALGKPERKNSSNAPWGINEQWSYPGRILSFFDDILIGF